MVECGGCGELKVDPSAPAQYDVFAEGYDPATAKPYCGDCFPDTVTGKIIAGNP